MRFLKNSIKILHGLIYRLFLPVLVMPPNQIYKGNIYTVHRIHIMKFLESWQDRISGRVLNVGAGTWDYPRRLLDSQCELVSTDFIEQSGVDVKCDIHNLTQVFPLETFDFVICFDVLEHIQYPWLAIIQLWDMLKPEGILLMTIPFHFYIHGNSQVPDFWRFTSDGIQQLLKEEARFAHAEVTSIGHSRYPFTYLIVAKK